MSFSMFLRKEEMCLNAYVFGVGNGAESCVDVRTVERWIWSYSWNDEE